MSKKIAVLEKKRNPNSKRSVQLFPVKKMEEGRSYTLKEIVAIYAKEVSACLGKGYTYAEVATLLASYGVEISPATLSNYHRSVLSDLGQVGKSPVSVNEQILKKARVQALQVRINTSAVRAAQKASGSKSAAFREIEAAAKKLARAQAKAG